MIIAIDFDGTIVEHEFPDIGRPVPRAISWMQRWQEAGAKLILLTMRSDDPEKGRTVLTDAVEFCRKHGIVFWAVNDNPDQRKWTSSRKVYANHYVDDAGFGCPLRENPNDGGRPFVDWDVVGPRIYGLILEESAKKNPQGGC